MKVMFICKKHYKQLMKEFKKINPTEAVEGVLRNPNIHYNLLHLGDPFRIVIKPFLKRIKIVDIPPYEFITKPQINDLGYEM